MKKSFVVFMTVIVIFLFSACVKHEDYSDETKRITMDVYDCLLEGDSEKLKSLFCEKTRNSLTLIERYRILWMALVNAFHPEMLMDIIMMLQAEEEIREQTLATMIFYRHLE